MLVLAQRLSPHTTVEIALRDADVERLPGTVQWVDHLDDSSGRFRHGIEFIEGPLAPDRFSSLILKAFSKETWEKLLW